MSKWGVGVSIGQARRDCEAVVRTEGREIKPVGRDGLESARTLDCIYSYLF